MANELTLTHQLRYSGAGNAREWSLVGKAITLTTDKYVEHLHSVGTSEEAMELGELSGALGLCWIKNHDATNYVEVRTATGGAKVVRVNAGEAYVFRFGSGITAPYIIADTAAVLVTYVIFPA